MTQTRIYIVLFALACACIATAHPSTAFAFDTINCTNVGGYINCTDLGDPLDNINNSVNNYTQQWQQAQALENNLKAQYGLSAFYGCYSQAKSCTTDSTQPYICAEWIQYCLESNAIRNQASQFQTQQAQPPTGGGVSADVKAQALCLLRKNATWSDYTNSCVCQPGYEGFPASGEDCTLIQTRPASPSPVPVKTAPAPQTNMSAGTKPVSNDPRALGSQIPFGGVATATPSSTGSEPARKGFWGILFQILNPFSWL